MFSTLYKYMVTNFTFDNLSKKTLISLFSDGRICGRIIEPLLAEIFEDFNCFCEGNNKYDLIRISTGQKSEVKTFTKNGCNLIPSCQIGSKRNYDREEYYQRIFLMEAYFIVDIRKFPMLYIIAHPSSHIRSAYPDGRKISDSIFNSNKIINLLGFQKNE